MIPKRGEKEQHLGFIQGPLASGASEFRGNPVCRKKNSFQTNARANKKNDDGAKTATLLCAFEGARADLPQSRTKNVWITPHIPTGELAVKKQT